MNADMKKQTEEFWKNAQQVTMPGNMKELFEENLVKSQEVYENAKDFAKNAEKAFEKVAKSTEKGAKELSDQVIKNVTENTDAAFKVFYDLIQCKDIEDATKVQTAYFQEQMANMQAQFQQLNEIAGTVAKDTAKATKTATDKTLSKLNAAAQV